MFQIARVAVDKATWHYDKLYDYYLPVELEGRVRPGCRVTVPFGSYNHRRLAIVLALSEDDTREKRKPVSTLVDEAPLLNTEMLGLLRYLKEHTYCTWFDGLRAILPAGIGVKVGVGLKLERTVKLDASELTEEERAQDAFVDAMDEMDGYASLFDRLPSYRPTPRAKELLEACMGTASFDAVVNAGKEASHA